MQKLFKIEIFSSTFEFKDFSVIDKPTISFDYLTLENNEITVLKKINASKGDYVNITDIHNNSIYQGIVADITFNKNTSSLTLRPLLSILDVMVDFDRTDLTTMSLEDFLGRIITNTYMINSDALQNISIDITEKTTTLNAKLNLKDNVHNLYEICLLAFNLYGVVVSANLMPQAKKINIEIGKIESNGLAIELDLHNILDKNIVIGDDYGALNKVKFINKADETQTATYYLTTDGTISTNNINRISPVFFTTEYIESDVFVDDAFNRANELLSATKYNNLIEVTCRTDDKLINPLKMKIGDKVTLITANKVYSSVMTGYELNLDIITLVFGSIRLELTKKLILERRK